jgi:hypothetical protein
MILGIMHLFLAKAIVTPSKIYWQNPRVCVEPDEINGTIFTLPGPPIGSRVSGDPD